MIIYGDDMMTARAQLPESSLSSERCFAVGLNSALDTHFEFWSGDLEATDIQPDAVGFQIMHSHEVFVLAALVGFCREALIEESMIRNIFLEAGQATLDSPVRTHDSIGDRWIDDIANGREASFDSRHDIGLKCIVAPIPSQPGGKLEATGIFTGRNEGEDLSLVFAPENTNTQQQLKLPFRMLGMAEVYQADVPVIAEALCTLSTGENKKCMAAFICRQFL